MPVIATSRVILVSVVQYSDSPTPYSPRAHHDKGTPSSPSSLSPLPPLTSTPQPAVSSLQLRAYFLVSLPFCFLPLLVCCFLSATWVKSYGICLSLTLLIILHSGSIQVIANAKISLFYDWVMLQCVCVISTHTYIHIGLLLGSLSCQWTLALAVGNNAAINTGACVSRGIRVFVFSWVVSSSAITGS